MTKLPSVEGESLDKRMVKKNINPKRRGEATLYYYEKIM